MPQRTDSPVNPLDTSVDATAYAALQAQFRELEQRHAALTQAYNELYLRKQQADLASRKAEYLKEQLAKERDELIVEKIDIRTALEELRAAQEEALEANLQLTAAFEQIQERDARLEEKNQELVMRGIELRTAMMELKATQQEVVTNEKLLALGQVIANIAHEINTPIGAIYAASQNVNATLPALLGTFPDLFRAMPEHLRDHFFVLIEKAKTGAFFDTRQERSFRQGLEDALATRGVANSETIARLLVKTGVGVADLEAFEDLLIDDACERILIGAVAVGRLRANLETIASAVGKTQKLIQSLKSYTDDDLTPQKGGTIDLVAQLNEVAEYYRHMGRHGLEIEVLAEPNLPKVTCLPDQLRQVWNHLMLNGIQAMPNGGRLSVRVGAAPDPQHTQVTVADTGHGIEPRVRSRIFEAFYTTRPEGEGSGLGLYVSRKIIHRHRGSIELVRGEPGRTEFAVIIPNTTTHR